MAAQNCSFDRDGDLLRDDWRVERIVVGIAQHKLEGVFAGRQFHAHLCLPRTELEVVFILRNRILRLQRFIHVDEQTMVTTVGKIIPRMGHAHIAGDGIMIVFNDPIPCVDHTECAVRLALDMRERVNALGTEWRRKGHELGLELGSRI